MPERQSTDRVRAEIAARAAAVPAGRWVWTHAAPSRDFQLTAPDTGAVVLACRQRPVDDADVERHLAEVDAMPPVKVRDRLYGRPYAVQVGSHIVPYEPGDSFTRRLELATERHRQSLVDSFRLDMYGRVRTEPMIAVGDADGTVFPADLPAPEDHPVAAFLAHARQDIDWLLAENERLRRDLAASRTAAWQ